MPHKATGGEGPVALYDMWRKKYGIHGREPSNVSQGDIMLDYEVQYGWLRWTPDILLDTWYTTLSPHRRCDGRKRLFGKVSEWFSLGTDGSSTIRQQMKSQLEATSRMASPSKFLESSFFSDVQSFVDSTNKVGASIPGTGGRVAMRKKTSIVLMQFTIGLHLSQVPTLLNTSSTEARSIWLRTEEHCAGKPPLFKALVALAAMTVRGVSNSNGTTRTCPHPKRYLHPWLVRTHFGDLANYVASKVGKDALQALPDDVWAVSQVSPDAIAFPFGFTDYVRTLDVAAVSGLIQGAIPRTSKQLCMLAKRTLKRKTHVNKALNGLGCGVLGFNASGAGTQLSAQGQEYLSAVASPRAWLESIISGRDLWTDAESQVSSNSKTQLMFKSMGSWRMREGEGAGRVYLECVDGRQRGKVKCLGGESAVPSSAWDQDVSGRMREVASRLHEIPWEPVT